VQAIAESAPLATHLKAGKTATKLVGQVVPHVLSDSKYKSWHFVQSLKPEFYRALSRFSLLQVSTHCF